MNKYNQIQSQVELINNELNKLFMLINSFSSEGFNFTNYNLKNSMSNHNEGVSMYRLIENIKNKVIEEYNWTLSKYSTKRYSINQYNFKNIHLDDFLVATEQQFKNLLIRAKEHTKQDLLKCLKKDSIELWGFVKNDYFNNTPQIQYTNQYIFNEALKLIDITKVDSLNWHAMYIDKDYTPLFELGVEMKLFKNGKLVFKNKGI